MARHSKCKNSVHDEIKGSVMENSSYKLYTAEQVRGIDYTAIHELGIAGYELMNRAAAVVVEVARAQFPSARHWLIMCGPGNNGGDGYVVARIATCLGIKISVCSLTETHKLKGDAAQAHADWLKAGGKVLSWPLSDDTSCDLALDALLGTGIDRQVGGEFCNAIAWMNDLDCPRLAIDIASGINADTGSVMGCAVRAKLSVSFVGRKRGMYTADGPDYCGPVVFDDLGIPSEAGNQYAADAGALLEPGFLTEVLRPRLRNSHKGSYGHVYAVGGMKGMSGAIRLCGEAALRSGSGRVTLATDPSHAHLVNLQRPELMVKAIDDGNQWSGDVSKDSVIALGPGLGGSAWSESLFEGCMASVARMVVDADGLNILARQPRQTSLNRGNWVLTPHPAEAARLMKCKVSDIQRDRVGSALALASRFAASVVLKGCGTVVASETGEYAICPLGNPGMATAGSGDVLTGIIAALLGQGLSCYEAAEAGVLAHAMAGDLAAEDVGEMSLLAGDIIDCLPEVWRSVTV
jgi:hydroxyethylthiazole kinase-like uncharacterized protein yjeF